ncbi:DctP family TRAP transporter solute-binding subunit [Halarsenatibacter silvermanii]|uniref:Tripartite ATP-independent transporter solute receptor, DctP family n=1 Tax=Halarsenatibacter silvermanii TaxID=321763 RepID=A0A1G9IAY5_9FIRM|nr:DctP family TRAP transporter solute-binding subunit [Halarsenatibacter silvermanii]SDL22276.1 tripartite ATP-independent transporter solute receptor, DctP family [Halarsenatibacter silvermanii]
MFKKLSIAALVISLVFIFSVTAGAQDVIQLSHLNPQNPQEVATAAMAKVFQARVEAETDIEVEIYPDGALGDSREMMEQVQGNVIQSFIASAGGLAPFYEPIGIVDIPFAISHYSVAHEVYDGEFADTMKSKIEQNTDGFEVLAFGESGGFFQLTNSATQIESPEDMDGVSFRTMPIAIHQEFVTALGASATEIAWEELYTALETGVVDGQMNPIPLISMELLYEVQDYITLTNHMYTPYVWVINDQFMEGLSEHEKSVIYEASRAANTAGRGVNQLVEASEDQGLPKIEEEMEVYAPTDEELEAFREITEPAALEVIEEEFGEEGLELAEEFLQAVEEAEEELGIQ